MELSPHRANGNDPFNLWQKHIGEEVPNARPVPWGGPLNVLSSPRLLPVRPLDSLTAASHLSSFTVQSTETGEWGGQWLSQPYKDKAGIDTSGKVTAEWGIMTKMEMGGLLEGWWTPTQL